MTDFLQISEQALPTDYQVVNYAAADIAAYSVLFLDTANALSVNNVVDGIAAKVTNAQTARICPLGVSMEIIHGTTFTGGTPGYGQCRSVGVAKCIASAAITAGVPVMNDTTGAGSVVAQTAGLPQVGVALTSAINAGDEIAVLVSIATNA